MQSQTIAGSNKQNIKKQINKKCWIYFLVLLFLSLLTTVTYILITQNKISNSNGKLKFLLLKLNFYY
jgi:flagellar basal body-associated protein FliL